MRRMQASKGLLDSMITWDRPGTYRVTGAAAPVKRQATALLVPVRVGVGDGDDLAGRGNAKPAAARVTTLAAADSTYGVVVDSVNVSVFA